jgi:class 3 adenylate cyclase
VLAEVFPDYPALIPTIGIELGDCVVANVGIRGDRELISVGSAANRAAKALGQDYMLTIAASLWAALPRDWQQLFQKVGLVYHLDPRKIEDPEALIADHGIDWSISKSLDQLNATRDSIPLDSIKSESAQEKIDLECLGPKHFKVCSGGTLFVDIDGFTALIESLFGDEEMLGKAVQLLHLFRYELRQVTETDSNGIVIQHQGDRMQALLHVPSDNEERIKRTVVELCIDCNSSVEEVLNQEPELLAKLHVAVGADFGSAIVLRSGVRGDLDAGCLGHATARAESLQLASAGNVIRISSALYDALTDVAVRSVFSKDAMNSCYKGEQATWTKVEDAAASKAYGAAATVAFHVPSREVHINAGTSVEGYKPLKQTRPWGE